MNRRNRSAPPLGMAALALLLAAAPAAAQVQNVAAEPAASNLAAGAATTLGLQWQAVTDQGPGTTLVSTVGTFRAGGPGGAVLGRVERTVSGTADVSLGNFDGATIAETVRVPERVTLRAQAAGADRIVYVRSFDDGSGNTGSGGTTLALTGGLGGDFDIRRVALRFDDGSVQRVVAPEGALQAIAQLTFAGSGRLEGRWEIARPASTRGEPAFRSIGLVRRELTGTGREATLRSPELPTRDDGIYLVRLRITSPANDLGPAEIGYAVNAGLDAAPEPAALDGLGPPHGATWEPGTRFEWARLDSAVAYRLELRDAPGLDTEPVSGVLVPAPADEAALSRVARSHLDAGRSYWWRIVAFDAHGDVIGHSPPRRLHVPGRD